MSLRKTLTLTGAATAAVLLASALAAHLARPADRALAFPFVVKDAAAEPSCGLWNRQPNGCDDRVCVGDDGRTYCEEVCGTGPVTKIAC